MLSALKEDHSLYKEKQEQELAALLGQVASLTEKEVLIKQELQAVIEVRISFIHTHTYIHLLLTMSYTMELE